MLRLTVEDERTRSGTGAPAPTTRDVDDAPVPGGSFARVLSWQRRVVGHRLTRTVVHGRTSSGPAGEVSGFQGVLVGVRALAVVVVLVVTPLAQVVDPWPLALGTLAIIGTAGLGAAWLRFGTASQSRSVAIAGLVGDSAAAYLVVQATAGSTEWISYIAYPLASIEAALVIGPLGVIGSILVSGLVVVAQFAHRRDLGLPASIESSVVVVGTLLLYGALVTGYAAIGRRLRGDLQALLAVSTLLAGQETPARIIAALDERIHELFGGRVRSVAVRRPDGTFEVLRWRTPETRTIDLAAVRRLSEHLGRDVETDLREGRSLTLAVGPGDIVVWALGLPEWVRSMTLVPIRAEGTLGGVLPVLWDVQRVPTAAELDLLNGFAEQTGMAFAQAQLRRARELAATDSLTGLANHRAFRDALTARIAEISRHGGRLAILFCDLDRFKDVNDRHGHGVGDLVLHRVAAAVRSVARTEDVVARYGGDEIAFLLPGADRAAAVEIGQRLRDRVRSLEGDLDIDVTVGVAIHPDDGDDPETLMARADEAMYAGKRAGGGRVVSAGELSVEA